MAARARIGNLVLIGHFRRDEVEGVTPHVYIGDRLFDLRHMTCDALASGALGAMVRVRFLSRKAYPNNAEIDEAAIKLGIDTSGLTD